jgi:hypothetical protein
MERRPAKAGWVPSSGEIEKMKILAQNDDKSFTHIFKILTQINLP